MHPYFSTHVQPWQTFNPIDVGMYQRPFPWFDPAAYQAMDNPAPYNPAPYRGAFPGFETNPYYAAILPRPVFHVPGASSRAEEPSPVAAYEVFGEALERFAREQGLGRGIGRELGELSEKARLCFRALAPESEQLERVRDESVRLGRKKAVNA